MNKTIPMLFGLYYPGNINKTMLDNIAQLLFSAEEENVLLALAFIQSNSYYDGDPEKNDAQHDINIARNYIYMRTFELALNKKSLEELKYIIKHSSTLISFVNDANWFIKYKYLKFLMREIKYVNEEKDVLSFKLCMSKTAHIKGTSTDSLYINHEYSYLSINCMIIPDKEVFLRGYPELHFIKHQEVTTMIGRKMTDNAHNIL